MTNSKPTQCERILDYMRERGEISAQEAMNELGVYRLASRINELKRRGISIRKRTVKVKNRYGEACTIAAYSLAEG